MIPVLDKFTVRVLEAFGRRFLSPKQRLALEYRVHINLSGGFQVSQLKNFGPNRGVAIDAGANMGVYSYALSRLYQSVEAFEVNPEMVEELRRGVAANVRVHQIGLSDKIGQTTMYLPISHGQRLHGWASLEKSSCDVGETHIEVEVSIATLDSFNLLDVGFIKVDVEGHELSLLRGAVATIEHCRPDVFIEVGDSNLLEVRSFFECRGYGEINLVPYAKDGNTYGNYLFKAKNQSLC